MNKPSTTEKIYGVYNPSVLTQKVYLMITEVGKNVKKNLETEILYQTTGKCIAEGILKPNSVRIINYSSGSIRGDKVEFQVVFECMVCHPVEGMLMNCVAKTITKAGIHAEVIDEDGTVPVTVFIARDHHFTNTKFANVTENEKATSWVWDHSTYNGSSVMLYQNNMGLENETASLSGNLSWIQSLQLDDDGSGELADFKINHKQPVKFKVGAIDDTVYEEDYKGLDAANRLMIRAQQDGVLMQDSRIWLSKARALTGHREYGKSITYYSMALEIDEQNEKYE